MGDHDMMCLECGGRHAPCRCGNPTTCDPADGYEPFVLCAICDAMASDGRLDPLRSAAYSNGKSAGPVEVEPKPGDLVNVKRSEWYALEDGEALQLSESWPWRKAYQSTAIPAKNIHGGRSFWGRRTGYAGDTSPEVMSTSGGPFITLDMRPLRWTGTTERTFWRWKDRPRVEGGEDYTRTVNVWALDVLPDEGTTQ